MKQRRRGNSAWGLEVENVPEAGAEVWFHKGEPGSLMSPEHKMKNGTVTKDKLQQ